MVQINSKSDSTEKNSIEVAMSLIIRSDIRTATVVVACRLSALFYSEASFTQFVVYYIYALKSNPVLKKLSYSRYVPEIKVYFYVTEYFK